MSKSIGQNMLICQCLSRLPIEGLDCPLLNYGKKMSEASLIKIFTAAQLDSWSSYEHMEEKIRAYPDLSKELDVKEISGAQLSRRINELPTEFVQKVFYRVVERIGELTKGYQGLTKSIGPLSIVDSTEVKLPENLCEWAFISKGRNAVKLHTRLMVVSSDLCYPDKVIPSTGDVSDFESSPFIIEGENVTFVTDRGYPSKKNLTDWLNRDISFVTRISKNLVLYTLEKYAPTHPSVIRDEKVNYGISREPVRYIEFKDEEGKEYRLLTTRFDLSDQEVLEIYRHGWMIELFFKWIKGHLKFTKLWSTNPQGIWNQMFIALIAFGLSLILKLETKSKKTPWRFFRVVQTYLYLPGRRIFKELERKKKRSKGRQKIPIPPNKSRPLLGNVALVKEKKK